MKTVLLASLLLPSLALAATAPAKPTTPPEVALFVIKASAIMTRINTGMLPSPIYSQQMAKLDAIVTSVGCAHPTNSPVTCPSTETAAQVAGTGDKLTAIAAALEEVIAANAPSKANLDLIPKLDALIRQIMATPGLDPDGIKKLLQNISLLHNSLGMPASKLQPNAALVAMYNQYVADFKDIQALALQHTTVLQMGQAFEKNVANFTAKLNGAVLPGTMSADFSTRRNQIVLQSHCMMMADGSARCCPGPTAASCVASISQIESGKDSIDNLTGSLLAQIQMNKLVGPADKLLDGLKDASGRLKASGMPAPLMAAQSARLAAVPAAAGCPGANVDTGANSDPLKTCPKATADTLNAGMAVIADVARKIDDWKAVASVISQVGGFMEQVGASRLPGGEKSVDMNQLHQFLDALNGGTLVANAAANQFSMMRQQIQGRMQLAASGLLH